jgi:hypothetical protein
MAEFAEIQHFYYGDISRQKAETILYQTGHSCFLVREGALRGSYAISIFKVSVIAQSAVTNFVEPDRQQ